MFSGLMSRWTSHASCAAASAARGGRGDVDRFHDGQRPAIEALAQSLAVDELRGDVLHVLLAADVVDGDHVRMIEQRRRAGLALEVPRLAAIRFANAKNLQRDLAPEQRVLGRINLCRTSPAEVIEDAVAADTKNVHGTSAQHAASEPAATVSRITSSKLFCARRK